VLIIVLKFRESNLIRISSSAESLEALLVLASANISLR
jgi:hypothetical protein